MKKNRLIKILCVVMLFIGFTGWGIKESAGGEIDKDVKVSLLRGDLWQQMTADSKLAFIWGMGHVVDIEQALMERYPELKKDGFVMKVVEGMADIPMNDVVRKIDNFYKANPDKLNMSVAAVIWDTMIKPNIKAGIAGRPLE